MGKITNVLTTIQKYIGAVIVGIHTAQTVPGATNEDKKAVVVSTVTGVADAVSKASTNPEVAIVCEMVDIGASVFNSLSALVASKAAAPAK